MSAKRGAVGGLIGAVGLVGGLIGYITDLYSSTVATVIMLGVWFVGGAIVALVFSGKKD